ncbi:hypothetical protein LTR78_003908 [Recurvomyces mirabilis]|uniref:Uncharacterized protein n=1 Tax=Recurvomyces mirabilis TaxID=574656 RepID=A0AAE0WR70_9PEZI|nr:hypothetical protein LTR78_003908 [Recurvomyces mirabilis]KAK5153953.1 hypothetical protein LTS14_007173 [Recurvomyces mirabilis]
MNRPNNSEPGRQKAGLLTIPAELRDIIYAYTLAAGTDVHIHIGRQQPAFLRTSRQVRAETIELYYSDNTFCFTVHAYRGPEIRPFTKLLQRYSKYGRDNLSVELCSDLKCADCHGWLLLWNLMVWLQAYYADKLLVPGLRQDAVEEHTRGRTLARRTFSVVDNMRHLPWDEVVGVLDAFIDAIEHFEEEDCEAGEGYHEHLSDDEDDSSEEDGSADEDESADSSERDDSSGEDDSSD